MKRIKLIQINPASEKSLSKSAKDLLDLFKIQLVIGSMQGARKDRGGGVINIDTPQSALHEKGFMHEKPSHLHEK
jgi:hypothetical protein